MQHKHAIKTLFLFAVLLLAAACGPKGPSVSTDATPTSTPNFHQDSLSSTGTPTEAASPIPTMTSAASPMPTMTSTPSPTPTMTPTPTPTPTPTMTPTPTPSPTPTPTPTPIPTVPPAPVAVNTDIENSYTFLINREYPLSETYEPSDLVVPNVPFSFSNKTLEKRKLRKVAAKALEELCRAAKQEKGLTIYGVSGYRSYDRQYDIYGTNIITKGLTHTNLYSAAPGTSEHQTGLAIDVSCASINYALNNKFAATAEGIWLKNNCWRFGYILRYPEGKEAITGYAYEPWHIRYVGVPLAYYLHQTGLTLDEYYASSCPYELSSLSDIALIDTTAERFHLLYASVMGGLLLYLPDGTLAISEESGYPQLIPPITDASGESILLEQTPLYSEPVFDAYGRLPLTEQGTPYFKKPYFDEDGILWLDFSNHPILLDALLTEDGTIAMDAEGNVLYTEPVADGNGTIFLDSEGRILQKLPMRDAEGALLFGADGQPLFYEPILNPTDGTFYYDHLGYPLFNVDYYFALEEEKTRPSNPTADSPDSQTEHPTETPSGTPSEPPSETLPDSQTGESQETPSEHSEWYPVG